jgi:hypothetical protein
MIDMASVYAERFKQDPRVLQAAVMGQSPDPKLDPYTALNALRLIKEANMMAMAGKAQQPTSAPSIVAETMAPPAPPAPPAPRGLGAMVPGAMGQAPRVPQPQFQPQPSGGLAAMPTSDRPFAGGGIVAFAGGDLVDDDYADPNVTHAIRKYDDQGNLVNADDDEYGDFDTENYDQASLIRRALRELSNPDTRETEQYKTPEQLAADRAAENKRLIAEAGPNEGIANLRSYIGRLQGEAASDKDRALGLGLLAAAKEVGGAAPNRWIGAGLGKFGETYGAGLRENRAQQNAIANMNFNMEQAARAEKLGFLDKAHQYVVAAEKNRIDFAKAAAADRRAKLNTLGRLAMATKPPAPKTPPKPSDQEEAIRIYSAELAKNHPDWSEEKRTAEALKLYQERKGPGLAGSVYGTTARTWDKAENAWQKHWNWMSSKDQKEMIAKWGSKEAYADHVKNRYMEGVDPSFPKPPASAPSGSPSNPIRLD